MRADVYQSLPSQMATALLLIVCAFAAWRGGTTHRVVAAAMAVNWLLSGLLQNRVDWLSPQWAMFSLDLVLAVVVTVLALRVGGFWLLALAAFTWLQAVTHLTMAVDDRLLPRGYLTALGLWSLAQLICLAYGVWRHRLDRRWRTTTAG